MHVAVTIDQNKAELYVNGAAAAVSEQIHTYLWELGTQPRIIWAALSTRRILICMGGWRTSAFTTGL